MKTQIKQLIDRLGPDNIYIGHILQEMDKKDQIFSLQEVSRLINLWKHSGPLTNSMPLTWSVQEILYRATWEEVECHINNELCSAHRFHVLVPKQPEIRALFELLLTLGI